MKRCPVCGRDYNDDSLRFCLDDGSELLFGPRDDAETTAFLPIPSSEAATRTFDSEPRATGEIQPGITPSIGNRKTIVAVLAVVVVAAVGVTAYYFSSGQPAPAKPIGSIAVMPFINASGDPDIEYLSDGITESLINSLSQVPNVSVKARSSVFTYKGKDVDLKQVAKDLSVEAVLEGRVTRIGDQIQLNVNLVDPSSKNQIWGQQYTRKLADILLLQSDIAREVSTQLREKLTGADEQRITRVYTQNTEAYQLYLKGRYLWNKRKPDDIKKSVEYFQQAIDKDPTYALAYAALAEAYILIPEYNAGSPNDFYPKARTAAQKAIEIDPSLAEAHNALSSVLSSFDWKFAESETERKKALELNPNYATGHQWYAEFLLAMGRHDEALAEMRRAEELDPLSLIINGMVGVLLRVNGRNDEALAKLQKTLEMDPDFPRTHLYIGETYQAMGRYEEAIDELEKSFILNGLPEDKVSAFAEEARKAYRNGGVRGYALKMAELFSNSNEASTKAPAVIIAYYWIKAGEKDRAFEILEDAFRRHDPSMSLLKDGRLKDIETDPRYLDLLRRVGFPQ